MLVIQWIPGNYGRRWRCLERRQILASQWKTSQPTGLEPAMDYFINADIRPGIGCRRKVLNVFFKNEEAESDHHQCDALETSGCLQCLITQSSVCCDIHTPAYFVPFISAILKQQKQLSRSHLVKFSMASLDFKLIDMLKDWQEETTLKLYGHAHLYDLGPGIIMPNSILDCIVECAHFYKIKSTADLVKETCWSGANKHGDEIIVLIHQVCPLPTPLTSAPLQPHTNPSNANASVSVPRNAKRKMRCSACGEEGHNARNHHCREHPANQSSATKENSGTTWIIIPLHAGL
ncbi:uncharacterized protein F5147DRAFT_590419 [Suillus discolor]|uniref:Uncharacterized protein n=1 Tax=Suillus discolor TaxID=1912936 RepID=A0A9P7ERP5_9AGAM|nr:uncharacterized protein F5147DRAFT_590419 [Suillus discolor]KAG2082329.1 hypothetical protein F5147DRAFT_590419 [Suillus discolor]